jgi:AmmeMemoRadiSam system protein A
MSLPEAPYAAEERRLLLDVASRSIAHGLRAAEPLPVAPEDFPEALGVPRASFVTLHLQQKLRGCVGGLEVRRPLVQDVAVHAFQAAFRDPRFAPLSEPERAALQIEISVLSPLERLRVTCEEDLLATLRPGVDGLLLRQGSCQGTFLPTVWRSLPDARSFVRELKHKAGLPPDHWSRELEVSRYTVASIG